MTGEALDTIRYAHLLCAASTSALFILRGLWMFSGSPQLRRRWTRIVPPIIDTFLLLTGIYMAIQIRQYPFTDTWLTVKLLAVLVYIIFGITAFRGRSKRLRAIFWCLALVTFAYIVLVARSKSPVPFAGAMIGLEG
jgi:uncharacterized membrane protein SirB2